jgi:hypothetical protein
VCDGNVEVLANSKIYEIFVVNIYHIPKIHLTDKPTVTSEQVVSEMFITLLFSGELDKAIMMFY